MAAPSTGIPPRSSSRWMRDTIELLSSMRFAIALLTVVCIASVIGTVIQQNQPATNYVNQFGPFWSKVFTSAGLTQVYSAWWFILILAFLVTSTTLCIVRNTPKILADLRQYKEHIREQALLSFHHRGSADTDETPSDAFKRVSTVLTGQGWRAKVQQRVEDGQLKGTMIAARKGASNKLGYIAAHSAIVLICVGGLLDGDLAVRAQMFLQDKVPFVGSGLISAIPDQHRLDSGTLTYRGNLEVPEGARRDTALLMQQDGVVLQQLPFDIELKKFIVEYYETGMPKLFASDVLIHDKEDGTVTPTTIRVNEPAFHRGVAIYQSSFDDGGSRLKLRAVPMKGADTGSFTIEGVVGGSGKLPLPGVPSDDVPTVEFTGLRVINVENMQGDSPSGTDVRKVDLVQRLEAHMGSGDKSRNPRELRNVGPSVTYKLRDTAGQAKEFHNYMVPVAIDGQSMYLAGLRDDPAEPFRYLRIPADDRGSMDDWLRLRAALNTPRLRDAAAATYAKSVTPDNRPEMGAQIQHMAQVTLGLLAGQSPAVAAATDEGKAQTASEAPRTGLGAMSKYIEGTVPEAERPQISQLMMRVLGGSLFELLNQTRREAGLDPLPGDEASQGWMTQAILSLSDAISYPAPVMLNLADFEHVQSSVFQVARAPGKTLVYLGCVALIIGVFAMLYIRERRLWIWLQPTTGGGTHIRTAMSTTRRTLDADAEFDALKGALLSKENLK